MNLCGERSRLTYADFGARIAEHVSRERTPLEGSLELTFRCNLRCAHCYVNEPSGNETARQQELTAAEIARFIDEATDLGCLWMLLTGGEPLLRPDFPAIYVAMKRKGLLLTLFTNATLLTPNLADLLAEWPPIMIEVGVYGSTETVYEHVTGVAGSFQRCIRGIDLLRERNIRFRLKTVPLTLNFEDMLGMRSLATAYGVELLWDPLVNCRIDGNARRTAIRLSPDQIVALEKTDPRRAAYFASEFGRSAVPEERSELFTCGAYLHTFHVDPYGHLFPCMMVRQPAYDLRKGRFRQGWDEFFPAMRKRVRTKASACDACRLSAACDQCVGWAAMETGDPERPVPYLCAVSQARSAAFGSRMENSD
jgi:radical SAM protein with 4Fe4S-binding SPASM domain